MATPDKTVESAAEGLYGDERLRSNLTDDEANLVLNWAVGWLEKRANVPAPGLAMGSKTPTAKRVSQASIDQVRQVVSSINGAARAPGTPRLDTTIPEILRPVVGDKPLTRQEVLKLLTVLAQTLWEMRAPQK